MEDNVEDDDNGLKITIPVTKPDVEIPVMEVQPESFNDVESLYALIQRLSEE